MFKALLAVFNKLALYFGTLLNLWLLSLPLFFVETSNTNFLFRPSIGLFFVLLGLFSLLEAKASFKLPFTIANQDLARSHHRYLPFFTAVLLLLIFQLSLYENLNQNITSPIQLQTIFIGGLMISVGIIFRLKSIATLKKYFVSHIKLVNNHQLITQGIFSVVRHPSEFGLLLIAFGSTVLLESLLAFMLTIGLLVPLTMYRVILEDQLLYANFKEAFILFQEKTPCLLPKFGYKTKRG